jgi:hypothetical protein
MRLILIFSLSLLLLDGISQVPFDNGNHLIGNRSVRSALSLGIADMNGDYKDDIVFMDQGTDLLIAYQNAPAIPFKLKGSGQILDNNAWALSLGDLDNDGISEVFACGINTFGNIFKLDQSGKYVFTQLLIGLTFPQNSNFADINNDGWLDVFICDERAYNDLFLNDQTGNMVYDDFIDMHTVPASNDSGNYGSEWVDFDDDRDIDLFITKCKPAIVDPNDPLRLNVLFVNDGNQNYTELAEQYGLKNGAQSWTGSFGDLDNDGDLDCFVSNHDTTHVIYENIGNHFVDVTTEWMVPLRSSSIQAAIRDFDNNGFMDIYVTGDIDYMLWNKGDRSFEVEENPLGLLNVFTFATGDLNDDGFLDIVSGHGLLNMPGNYDDVIWLNRTNKNHYLKISFYGEGSNRKGVGTKVKLYSQLGIQTRDVKIGESYGTTNSGNVHFGLEDVTQVDSMEVYWPSGQVDRYYAIDADQHLLAHEAKCLSPFIDIQHDGDNVICEGEEIELWVPGLFDTYEWSNGQKTPTIKVTSDADIFFKGTDENGCVHHSNIKKIYFEPDETPELSFFFGQAINCEGATVTLKAPDATAYQWSTGETGQFLYIEQPGDYTVTITGKCAEFESEPMQIDFFYVPVPELAKDTIELTEPAALTLEAVGNEILWFKDPEDISPIAIGNLETGVLDRDTAFYVSNRDKHIAQQLSVGMAEHMGTALGGANLNSGLMFNCFKAFTLEQFKVITDLAGYRTFELQQLDEDSGSVTLLDSRRLWVDTGSQYLDLNFFIEPGVDYILTTNPDSNLVNLGTKSPALYRSNQGVAYPYSIMDILEITTSLHGALYYYYFFDWKVRPESISCQSEKIAQYVVIDTVTNMVNPLEGNYLFIHPNPASDAISLSSGPGSTAADSYKMVIQNQKGETLRIMDIKMGEDIPLGSLSSGIYILSVVSKSGKIVLVDKLVVIK